MKKKHKMTGCARLFIVLLILGPLAYAGAALYKGENPIDNVKELLGIEKGSAAQSSDTYSTDDADDLREELREAKSELRKLQRENEDLMETIKQQKEEIANLKQGQDE